MTTRLPTTDQLRVLASTARVRLVKASPGSGKTWLVAEAIRREISEWDLPHAGIAALSFTRVGGDEIRAALGRALVHPHFVGTIDAFLFRFVVRPHLRVVDPLAKLPVLIPPDWKPADLWQSQTVAAGINPFACSWVRRDATGNPVLSLDKRGERIELNGDERRQVVASKQRLRRQRGLLTISDSALLASEILSHPVRGAMIRGEIARRFPLLVVDELQDTGVFLAESVRSLIAEDAVRALLVGDPDQAIFEFTGADSRAFDGFSRLAGTETLTLSASRRCPHIVIRAATHVKSSEGTLHSSSREQGSATLVRYTELVRDIGLIATVARSAWPSSNIKVIARHNSSVFKLKGSAGSEALSLSCRPATLVQSAVRKFRQGSSVAALAACQTALELNGLNEEGLTDDELAAKGVEAREMRSRAIECLLEATAVPLTGTVRDWQTSALALLYAHAELLRDKFALPPLRRRRPPNRGQGHGRSITSSIQPAPHASDVLAGIPLSTVHGVKGETHDATIFVTPPISASAASDKCPSVLWWSSEQTAEEERRIAYVAFTRTREHLVLCVHEPTYERLQRARPEFVSVFECCDVDGFSDCISRRGTSNSESRP